jgi:hypothetical protein
MLTNIILNITYLHVCSTCFIILIDNNGSIKGTKTI